MTIPVGALPDGAWFAAEWRGQTTCVGLKLRANDGGDTKVRFVRRWGDPAKDEQWISSASPVTRVQAPGGDAVVADAPVEPEFGVAPQELAAAVSDPFGES